MHDIDVIVIGAGPAGVASAVTIAHGGKKVVVLERTDIYGSKNMFGGAIYIKSIKDLFPNSWQDAPYESEIKQHRYCFLTQDASTEIVHKNTFGDSITVFRPKFDTWMVNEAKKEGVIFAPNTVVREILVEQGIVVGVKTDLEEFRAPLTIIAEGSHSTLSQQIGLKKELQAKNLILGVKETLKLDKEKIKERFGSGCLIEFFGGLDNENPPLGMGFLYTFKNHIAIGLGVNLSDSVEMALRPYDLLEILKSHPDVAALIKDGEPVEYSAHTIPGGQKDLAELYTHGALVVGDAAGFVNSVHFEGTNLAIYSGIYAGETALSAIEKNDYSKKTLKKYKEKIDKSFITTDLKSYKNIMTMLKHRAKSVFGYYPKKMDEFFTLFNSADGIPKKTKYRGFIWHFLRDRELSQLLKDFYQFAKSALEVIK